MISLFVANTDNSWFDFLASEQDLKEVNFWWPGETNFRALQAGEILAFRLKSPRNKIGGFGVFSSHSRLPIQMAWEAFGRGNGVASLEGLRNSIAQLRTNIAVVPSTDIGSTVLVQPTFFPPERWFDVPKSWSSSIQRGKRYSADEAEGLQLWNKLLDTANASGGRPGFLVARPNPVSRAGSRALRHTRSDYAALGSRSFQDRRNGSLRKTMRDHEREGITRPRRSTHQAIR